MMSGAQLSVAIAAVLVAAVSLGWFLRWLWTRLSPTVIGDTARINEMIDRLHEADRALAVSEEARELAENLLASREAEMENRMAAMQARLDGVMEGREAHLSTALREARAEAEATMSGLRNARSRIHDLEAELEALRTGQAADPAAGRQ